jgi:HK97 family phage major capsid protein
MSLTRARELRAERATLAEQARAILNKADSESRAMTAEEDAEFERIHQDIETKKTEVDRLERQAEVESEMREARPVRAGRADTEGDGSAPPDSGGEGDDGATERRREAFGQWLRFGMAGISPEHRELMQGQARELSKEERAMAAGTDLTGGFLVPTDTGLMTRVVEAMSSYGGMRRARTFQFTTETGADLPIPTDNDTSNEGELLGENVAAAEQDVNVAQVVMHAYMYSSKVVRVGIALLQDAAFDIEGWLAGKLATRLGRISNRHYTTGDAAAKPEGVFTGAAVGKTGATGQTTSVTVDDLWDLKHSVDPDYREAPEWMFHDDTLLKIKKIKDGEGRPIWQSGLAVREPDSIDGDPYVINQHAATMTASARSIAYGDFSTYYIRTVQGLILLRLTERYAERLQVGFLAFQRQDGKLIDAGTNPIKVYVNSAS